VSYPSPLLWRQKFTHSNPQDVGDPLQIVRVEGRLSGEAARYVGLAAPDPGCQLDAVQAAPYEENLDLLGDLFAQRDSRPLYG